MNHRQIFEGNLGRSLYCCSRNTKEELVFWCVRVQQLVKRFSCPISSRCFPAASLPPYLLHRSDKEHPTALLFPATIGC